MCGRILEVGREAVQPHPAHGQRRRQVDERRQQLGQRGVFGRVFAGKAVEQVPLHLDARLGEPLQRLQVLHGRGALADELQQRRDERLDAQLGGAEAGVQQRLDLPRA